MHGHTVGLQAGGARARVALPGVCEGWRGALSLLPGTVDSVWPPLDPLLVSLSVWPQALWT